MTDHEFVGGYEIDPSRPNVCQVCEKRHRDTMTLEDALAAVRSGPCDLSGMMHVQEAAHVLKAEVERLQIMIRMITDELDASEPRKTSGQSCGPRAEDWVMTPSTRRALRWVLKWTPVKKETP